MKIAIIGVKGVPVIYSGFETFAEEFSTRLVKDKNYKVTVYCRKPYVKKKIKKYKDVELIVLPTIKTKNFETIIHSFLSTLHACMFKKYDVIYYLGVGNAVFTLFPRIFGIKTMINVDGFDWKREKWGSVAKSYLKLSSYLAMYFSNIIITDSIIIKNYYNSKYKKNYYYIPYGYMENARFNNSDKILREYNLKKNKYFVWVGRIVPENNVEDLLNSFIKLNTDFKCVIIGDNFYHDNYTKEIFRYSRENRNIIFTGFISRDEYAVLVKNAFCYIETKRSGGTHPSLIEAMGFESLIISCNNLVNRQLLKSHAFYYNDEFNLFGILSFIISPSFKNSLKYKKGTISEVRKLFYWKKIIEEYIKLFNSQF